VNERSSKTPDADSGIGAAKPRDGLRDAARFALGKMIVKLIQTHGRRQFNSKPTSVSKTNYCSSGQLLDQKSKKENNSPHCTVPVINS